MGDGKVPSRSCDEMSIANSISLQEREILQKYYKILDEHHRFVNEKERLFRDQWHRLTENESSIEKMLNIVLKDMKSELPEEDMSVERLTRISDKISFIHNEYLCVKRQLMEKSASDALYEGELFQTETGSKYVVNDAIFEKASSSAEQPTVATVKHFKKLNESAQSSAADGRAKTSVMPVDVVITEEDMSTISMQVNKGQPTHKCAECHAEVTNDYVGHKDHVIKRHIAGYKEGDLAAFISKFIQFCFPSSIAINDLQCCICGLEMQSNSGRRLHVGRQHSYSFVNCPVEQCENVFPTVESANHHLRTVHRLTCNDLEGPEKLEFEKQRITYNHKVRLLMAHCFPYPIPSSKGAEDADVAVDTPMVADLPQIHNEKVLLAEDDEDRARSVVVGKNYWSAQQPEQAQPLLLTTTVGKQNKALTTTTAVQEAERNTNGNNSSEDDGDNDEELQRRKRLSDMAQQIDVENKRNRSGTSFSLSNTRPYWEMRNGVALKNRNGVPEYVEEPDAGGINVAGDLIDSMDSDETNSDREVDILEVVGPGVGVAPLNRRLKFETTAKCVGQPMLDDSKSGVPVIKARGDKIASRPCVDKQVRQRPTRRRNDGDRYKTRSANQPQTNNSYNQNGKRRRSNSTNSSSGRGGCHHCGNTPAGGSSHYRSRKKSPLLETPTRLPFSQTRIKRNCIENNRRTAGERPHPREEQNTRVANRRNQNSIPYHKTAEIKNEVKQEEC